MHKVKKNIHYIKMHEFQDGDFIRRKKKGEKNGEWALGFNH